MQMVSGQSLWQGIASGTLVTRRIGGKQVQTYRDLPPGLYQVLRDTQRKYPEKTAIVDNDDTPYSYSDLLTLTDQLAGYLHGAHHIRRGDRVGLLLYSSIEFCAAFFALCKLGAAAVPLPEKYKRPQILSLADKAEVCAIICEEEYGEWLHSRSFRLIQTDRRQKGFAFRNLNLFFTKACGEPDDVAVVMFTSGTTSQSKGVPLKNYNIMHAVASYQKTLGITDRDKAVLATPIYNITGMVALVGLFVYAGGTLFLHRKFDAVRVLQCAVENKLTFLHASPTVFSLLLDHREAYPRLPDMRMFACGGGNLPAGHIRRLKQWIPSADMRTVYGLTETSSPATIFPAGASDSPYIGSSGIPIPGVEVSIADDAGEELGPGQIGEICLRGTVVAEGYLNGGEEAFTADGWFKSGDLGYLNAEGYLYVADRKKDIINRGGEKICSFDVENALQGLPGVLEAAVVGIPHHRYGEQPAAVIRTKNNRTITEQEIREKLAGMLANYMIPVKILFVEALPKTLNGKIDKTAVKSLFS